MSPLNSFSRTRVTRGLNPLLSIPQKHFFACGAPRGETMGNRGVMSLLDTSKTSFACGAPGIPSVFLLSFLCLPSSVVSLSSFFCRFCLPSVPGSPCGPANGDRVTKLQFGYRNVIKIYTSPRTRLAEGFLLCAPRSPCGPATPDRVT